MRVFQDPAVDGYTLPVVGQISNDVTYTFTITVQTCDATISIETEYSRLEFMIGTSWNWPEEVVTVGLYEFK